jgi:hypothetical protein
MNDTNDSDTLHVYSDNDEHEAEYESEIDRLSRCDDAIDLILRY